MILWLILSVLSVFIPTVINASSAVGYVGPACVVVDDVLYLHGAFSRRLLPEEVLSFKKYQNTVSLLKQLKEAVSKGATLLNNGSISLPTPIIPAFCEGFGDDVEVVLDGCIVRQNYAFVDNRMARPLNTIERQKVLLVQDSFAKQSYRAKRDSTNETTETTTATPSTEAVTTEDTTATTTTMSPISDELKELLSKYLNINNNVTERFLPVAQYSPVVNHLLNRPQLKHLVLNDDVQDEFQKQKIREFIQDHIMKYQSRSLLTTTITPTTTTEIPHLMLPNTDEMPQSSNPYLNQLLQRMNYNRQMELYQQQLQQQSMLTPTKPTRYPGAVPMKPGDTLEIGDQTYIAVPLSTSNGETVGLVPLVRSSTHTVTMLPPMRPWMRSNTVAPEQVRYHPGKRRSQYLQVPTHVNGTPLPHEICRTPIDSSN
ncbi:unnamed protein product [Bursaphelenchus okinawaensis]|uniref:Pepsin inhibitor-3-like repeated domain-containing protein n=1 Tax=Bursaphelenchus okinawaensis TaxID=465554 RepID=A0A811K7V2_9BILA|nr:unnamed protein product [Bursaphelenchus okinawaensis]CAG9093555.1 unnamed protein product [Bursaphelenchus okinawaensis]